MRSREVVPPHRIFALEEEYFAPPEVKSPVKRRNYRNVRGVPRQEGDYFIFRKDSDDTFEFKYERKIKRVSIDLSTLTKKVLLELSKALKIPVKSSMRKAEILSVLENFISFE